MIELLTSNETPVAIENLHQPACWVYLCICRNYLMQDHLDGAHYQLLEREASSTSSQSDANYICLVFYQCCCYAESIENSYAFWEFLHTKRTSFGEWWCQGVSNVPFHQSLCLPLTCKSNIWAPFYNHPGPLYISQNFSKCYMLAGIILSLTKMLSVEDNVISKLELFCNKSVISQLNWSCY